MLKRILMISGLAIAGTVWGQDQMQSSENETYWIDVRTPAEYAERHKEGAINIPLDQLAAQIGEKVPDKNTKIRLYCRSGNRSGSALQQLTQMGYTQATNEGGIDQVLPPTKSETK